MAGSDVDGRQKKERDGDWAHPTWGADGMGGRPGAVRQLAAQVIDLGTLGSLLVLDGLVAAGTLLRQSRPFLVYCRYCTAYLSRPSSHQPAQIKCDLAERSRTRTETWPTEDQEHQGYLCLAALLHAVQGILIRSNWSCTCHSLPRACCRF